MGGTALAPLWRLPATGRASRRLCSRLSCRLPRLAHLRLSRFGSSCTFWGTPAVAAELARCPALRLLEVERPDDPLWRHELGPADNADPCAPRPPSAWPPFVKALRAGGCRATVRPAPGPRAMYVAVLGHTSVREWWCAATHIQAWHEQLCQLIN
jgi:hypothetical protein